MSHQLVVEKSWAEHTHLNRRKTHLFPTSALYVGVPQPRMNIREPTPSTQNTYIYITIF
jgi:hypothetical protein